MTVRLGWTAILVLGLMGCHLALPLSGGAGGDSGTPDSAASDMAPIDAAAADQTGADQTGADLADAGSPDVGRTDAAAADQAPADAGAPDVAQPDLPQPDLLPPVSPTAAFGPPVLVTEISDPTIKEDDPTLTADMLEIYFERNNNIWFATRATLADLWDPPQKSTLSSSAKDGCPELSADGLTIYLCSERVGTQGLYDVFMATRSSRTASWSAPQPVLSLNSPQNDRTVALTEDMLTLVVTSDRLGTKNDLFETNRNTITASWPTPLGLGNVNTLADVESGPWIDKSAKVLYFASDRPTSAKSDIWVVQRTQPGGVFGTPVKLLSSPADEKDPWLSPDMRTIYFTRVDANIEDIYTATR